MRALIRPLLIIIGTASVALAVLGMFIPILPTTPFLLVAAACYARSSDRFLHWLLYNRWFGAYIRNYREGRGMPRATKVLTLLSLWVTLALSAVFATSAWWLRLLLAGIGLGVSVHLLKLKTHDAPASSRGSAPHITPAPSDEP